MSNRLSETLPLLLQNEMSNLLAQVSLPVTARIFLNSTSKFLPQLTENQANEVAERILDFAGKVWKLQQDAKVIEIASAETQVIEEANIRALPSAGN